MKRDEKVLIKWLLIFLVKIYAVIGKDSFQYLPAASSSMRKY